MRPLPKGEGVRTGTVPKGNREGIRPLQDGEGASSGCRAALWVLAVSLVLLLASSWGVLAEDSGVLTLRLDSSGEVTSEDKPLDRAAPQSSESTLEKPPTRSDPGPCISGASACIMDATTGQVVWSKKPHVRRPNASTTKIMTAVLIIEQVGMATKIRAGKKVSETPFTSIHLKPGETISARDLLMALMIRSANDAAAAAAEHISGSVGKFAALMNAKAKAIGCSNTHFVTPNGLHTPGHYSSAYDLCLIARYAMRYPLFNEVVKTRRHSLDSRSVNRKDLVVFNQSKFLKNYPGADGVKSGYVKQAGYCYVGSATRDGWRLVSAVLKSDNAGADTALMMDHVYNNFNRVTVVPAGKSCALAEVEGGATAQVGACPKDELTAVAAKSGASVSTRVRLEPVRAPVVKGMKLGTVTALVDGIPAATLNLYAADDVGVSFARRAWFWLKTCGIVALCVMVGRRYATTSAKSARRRGGRFAPTLRSSNRRW